MLNTNLEIAEGYYKAMGEKNLEEMGNFLHPEVAFSGPIAQLSGKESVLESAAGFFNMFDTIEMRAKCSGDEHAMLAYNLICPAPIGKFKVAALLTIKDDLIYSIELFSDASQLKK